MKNIKITLCLTLTLAFTATSTLADDGQIPIGGVVPTPTPNSITAPANDSEDEISTEIADYLRILLNAINQVNR